MIKNIKNKLDTFIHSNITRGISGAFALSFAVLVVIYPYAISTNLKEYNGGLLRFAMLGMVICILNALGFRFQNIINKLLMLPIWGWLILIWYSVKYLIRT